MKPNRTKKVKKIRIRATIEFDTPEVNWNPYKIFLKKEKMNHKKKIIAIVGFTLFFPVIAFGYIFVALCTFIDWCSKEVIDLFDSLR